MRLAVLTLCFLGCVALLAFAVAPPGRLPAEVGKWIDQLGDDETREEAHKKLEALGESVLPRLREALKSHADADVRLRAAVLAAAIEKKEFGEIRTYTGHEGWVYRFVVMPDGKKMVSSGDHIRVWDLETGKVLVKFNNGAWSWAMCPSRDSKFFLAGLADNTVRYFSLEGATQQTYLKHTMQVWVTALTHDGKHAITGSIDKSIHLWEIASGKTVREFENVSDIPRCGVLSPDGKYLAVGHYTGPDFFKSEATLRVWDVATGKLVRSSKAVHTGAITSVAYSPDGKQIATSSFDKTVRLWNASTLAEEKSLKVSDHGCDGVAYVSGGKRLLTTGWGDDHAVRVWDIETGKVRARYDGHSNSVLTLGVVSDGKRFVTGSSDGTLKLWPLPR